jgi:hypothetical protein
MNLIGNIKCPLCERKMYIEAAKMNGWTIQEVVLVCKCGVLRKVANKPKSFKQVPFFNDKMIKNICG